MDFNGVYSFKLESVLFGFYLDLEYRCFLMKFSVKEK